MTRTIIRLLGATAVAVAVASSAALAQGAASENEKGKSATEQKASGQESGSSDSKKANDPDRATPAPGSPTEGITGTHGEDPDAAGGGASSK